MVLEALRRQELLPDWKARAVICDDGSTDNTAQSAAALDWPAGWSEPLILAGKHSGVAAARNRGIASSRADILFFLGADIILLPGSLKAHLQFHQDNPRPTAAALGMIKWDPRIKPTIFMEWMTRGGPQNDFDSLLGRLTCDPAHYFYGSHLSIKRRCLEGQLFSEDYRQYGWEDLDLGRRLAKDGLSLTVLHSAIGLHRHFYTIPDIYRRQRTAGKGLSIYTRRNPGMPEKYALTPIKSVKILLFWFCGGRLVTLLLVQFLNERGYFAPSLFTVATTSEFLIGRLIAEKLGVKV